MFILITSNIFKKYIEAETGSNDITQAIMKYHYFDPMLKNLQQYDEYQEEKKVLDQFMSGKSLFGADGAFAPMLKNVIEKALEPEMDSHLSSDERSKGNKLNGKGNKKLKSGFGSFDTETPEDRQKQLPTGTGQKAIDDPGK